MKTEIQEPPSAEPEVVAETAASESEALLKDLAEQKDLHLRLAADFDNFKKRSRQESEARAVAQKESFIVELLPVIDNLERALAAGASRDSAQFHQGVEMTLNAGRASSHSRRNSRSRCPPHQLPSHSKDS